MNVMTSDMSGAIIPKSTQLSAEDFLAGPRTYTIERVEIRAVTEQPVSIFLAGEDRAWLPCKSMSRCLVAAWGPDAKVYSGRAITLYRDPKVKWGGLEVGGIRISHMSHMERDMVLALTETRGKRAPFIVKTLAAPSTKEPAQPTDPSYTVEQACDDIAQAPDLDALKAIWQRKAMAPYRDQLQGDLDARKAAFAAVEPAA